ncbi:MAG: hypothetical protein ACON5B_08965 [Myxococcota bacterium]
MSRLAPLMLVVLCTACRPSLEAPEDLDALSRFLFAHADDADDALLVEGLLNLEPFLDPIKADAALPDRSWSLTALTLEEAQTATEPPRSLDEVQAVGIALPSVHAVMAHVDVAMREDQTPVESTAAWYDRVFLDEPNGDCFRDRSCDRIRTNNIVRRDNLLISIDFEQRKDFRWLTLGDRDAVLARAWFEQSWEGDAGATTLWQNYGLEALLEQPDGSTHRYQVIWSDADVRGIGDDLVLNTLRAGADGIWRDTDKLLDSE